MARKHPVGTRFVTARMDEETFTRFRALCDRNHLAAYDAAGDAIDKYCDLLEAAEVRAVDALAAQVGAEVRAAVVTHRLGTPSRRGGSARESCPCAPLEPFSREPQRTTRT
jgi:hypothetical protein